MKVPEIWKEWTKRGGCKNREGIDPQDFVDRKPLLVRRFVLKRLSKAPPSNQHQQAWAHFNGTKLAFQAKNKILVKKAEYAQFVELITHGLTFSYEL